MYTPPHDHAEFFSEQAEFLENFQKAADIWLEISQLTKVDDVTDVPLDPFNLGESWGNAWLNFWKSPEKALEKQARFFSGLQDIWAQYYLGQGKTAASEQPISRRFKNPAWQENVNLAFLKSSYEYMHSWMSDALKDVKDLREHDKIVAELSMRNIVEAMNPANFAFSNPDIIEATMEEKGANLVRGLKMMREDIERGKGQLLLRQVDSSAFEVGENVAITKGKVIFQNEHLQLIQYAPTTKDVSKTPVLFIPPWINKFYILDLNEKKSFAKWIVDQGYTTFMISWVNPDERSIDMTWETRLAAIREAIGVVIEECGAPQTHLISFCIGGTMTGSLLAELDRQKDDVVASSTFLTAQFDFEHAGELMAYVSDKSVAMLDQYEIEGFIPAEAMSNGFNLLRSNDLIWSYIVNNYWLGKPPMAFDLLYWNSDSMRMPIKVQKYYLEKFYLKNAFMKNELPISDHKVGVDNIRVPTYHLAAIDDHIAPAYSVYIAAQAMKNAKVKYVLSGSGHIAGVVNPPAQEKYMYWTHDDLTPSDLNAWQEHAQEHKGSWWIDWREWMNGFETEAVPARAPGQKHKPMEDAPGSFVRVRFDDDA